MTHSDASGAAERQITIDAEHFAVRFWVPVLALALAFVVHLVGTNLVGDMLGEGTSPLCVVLPADVLAFMGGSFALERLLKRHAPSRRSATLTEQALIVNDRRHSRQHVTRIDWERTVNVKAWRFVVRRRSRIPKGWYCMAVQLLQDEDDVILYTFMPPEEAEQVASQILGMMLRTHQTGPEGQRVKRVLVEEAMAIGRELYLGIVIDRVAGELGVKARIALRVNPDVDAGAHPYIATGLREAKFGIDIEEALSVYGHAALLPNVEVVGVHQHIGSQITSVEPFRESIAIVGELVKRLQANGTAIRFINIGGGFGIPYHSSSPKYLAA